MEPWSAGSLRRVDNRSYRSMAYMCLRQIVADQRLAGYFGVMTTEPNVATRVHFRIEMG